MVFALGETQVYAQTSKPKGRAARAKARKEASNKNVDSTKKDEETEPMATDVVATPTRARYSELPTAPKDFKPVFDLPNIAGKTPEEVEKILGKPVKQGTVKSRGRTLPQYHYATKTPLSTDTNAQKNHDIVYVDGKADWIGITGTGDIRFSPDDILKCANIPPGTPPSVTARGRSSWENNHLAGYKNITAFPDELGKTSYIYVNVFTSP